MWKHKTWESGFTYVYILMDACRMIEMPLVIAIAWQLVIFSCMSIQKCGGWWLIRNRSKSSGDGRFFCLQGKKIVYTFFKYEMCKVTKDMNITLQMLRNLQVNWLGLKTQLPSHRADSPLLTWWYALAPSSVFVLVGNTVSVCLFWLWNICHLLWVGQTYWVIVWQWWTQDGEV